MVRFRAGFGEFRAWDPPVVLGTPNQANLQFNFKANGHSSKEVLFAKALNPIDFKTTGPSARPSAVTQRPE